MVNYPACCSAVTLAPTCVLMGLCRSAVTVADEVDGTSSIGDFEKAGGSTAVLGVDGCWPELSVKVTDLFWSPCAVGTHARSGAGGQKKRLTALA